MNERRVSYLYVILGASLWGGIGVFAKFLAKLGFTTMQVVTIRVAVSALVMTVYLLFKDPRLLKIRPRDCGYFIGTGIVSLVLFNYCYFTCINLSSISVAAVLLYTAPTFVSLLSIPLFHERMTGGKAAALAMTFAGCFLTAGALGGGGRVSPAVLLSGLGSGLLYALYTLCGKFALRRYDSDTVSAYTFLFGAAATLPFTGLWRQGALLAQPRTLACCLGIGVLCCMVPYILYTRGLTGVEASRASILATVEPAVAALLSMAVFGERLTPGKTAGMLLILGAIFVVNARPSVAAGDAGRTEPAG